MKKLELALKNLESFGLGKATIGELLAEGVTWEFLTSEDWESMIQ